MEDFVNFKLAQKLKEKGFREECLYHYPCSGGDYAYANCCPGDDVNTDYLYQCNNKDSDRLIDAPTISQVLKWLRDKKKLYVGVTYIPKDLYYATIQYIGDYKRTILPNDSYDNWKGAALNGIEYVLDNLIRL